MPSDAEIRAFARSSNTLVDAAMRAVRHLWAETQAMSPDAVRDAFMDAVPEIVDTYGMAAGELASEFFEQSTGLPVDPAKVPTADMVRAQTRYRAGALFNDGEFISALALDVDKYVKLLSRQTMWDGAKGNQVLYARVPSGTKTCAWCLMLAGRDAVYSSRRAAGDKSLGNEYHGDCDCQPVAVRSVDDYPDSYRPGALEDMYKHARDNASDTDANSIAAEMRRMFPSSVTDSVLE